MAFSKLKAALRKGAKRTVKELWRLIGKLVKSFAPTSAPTIFATRDIDDDLHQPEFALAASRVAESGRNDADSSYECDVLVVGSGAAGMSGAVTAGHCGLNVLIVEKGPRFGGTTTRSGGWLWIPGTSLARRWGIVESPDQARTYLRHEASNSFDAALGGNPPTSARESGPP